MIIRRILYATDLSDASARALEPALYLARELGAEIEALHVAERLVDILPVMSGVPTREAEPDPSLTAESLQHLQSWLAPRVPPDTTIATHVTEGEPADRIVGRAAERAADLIVMGTHGHSAVERFFLGSVTEEVLRKAPCPVLAIPAPRPQS